MLNNYNDRSIFSARINIHYYYRFSQFKAVLFHATMHDPKRPKYKGPFSMNYWERRFHARGVYSSHGNNKGEARRGKQKNNSKRIVLLLLSSLL